MKRLILLLLLGLFLVACTTATPAADPAPVDTEPTPERGSDVARVESTAVSEPVAPAATIAEIVEPMAEAVPVVVVDPTKALATATTESVNTAVVSGRTADGAFFLGAPDAPITLIDYSDFL
jgi:protein-disulfide isomerase